MPREIKFRAWDKEKKYIFKIFDNSIEDWYLPRWKDRFEVMEFTGLKDKNDKEIYERDILRKEGCWDVRIEFENGVFWVRDADEVRYNNKILNTPIALFSIKEFEIVGNIYENPGLLDMEGEI